MSTDRISNISATPTHRLCTRMKNGMWNDSGNQNLTARAAIEDTSKPHSGVPHDSQENSDPLISLHSRSSLVRPCYLVLSPMKGLSTPGDGFSVSQCPPGP